MLVRNIRKKVSESNIKINIKVKLDNTVLEVVSEIKYLGVMRNRKTFSSYIILLHDHPSQSRIYYLLIGGFISTIEK